MKTKGRWRMVSDGKGLDFAVRQVKAVIVIPDSDLSAAEEVLGMGSEISDVSAEDYKRLFETYVKYVEHYQMEALSRKFKERLEALEFQHENGHVPINAVDAVDAAEAFMQGVRSEERLAGK